MLKDGMLKVYRVTEKLLALQENLFARTTGWHFFGALGFEKLGFYVCNQNDWYSVVWFCVVRSKL